MGGIGIRFHKGALLVPLLRSAAHNLIEMENTVQSRICTQDYLGFGATDGRQIGRTPRRRWGTVESVAYGKSIA